LDLELWIYHGSYPFGGEKQTATATLAGPVALLALTQPVRLEAVNGWGFEGTPTVTVRVDGLDVEDARCVRQFLQFSDGW
jgi:hypothetical protein